MIPRYQTEEIRKQAETIYILRQQGRSLMDIARQMGLGYQNLIQLYRRECLFKALVFYYLFFEYIANNAR